MKVPRKTKVAILAGTGLVTLGLFSYLFGCRIGLNFLCRSDFDPQLTFLDYCRDQDRFAAEIVDTVQLILREYQTESCQEASLRLQKEEKLNLGRRQISNIFPLNRLENIRGLMIYENKIADIRPLASMGSLEWLNLSVNEVKDLTPLAELKSLQFLDVSSNHISGVDALEGLKELRVLRLDNNPLGDLKAIRNLDNLVKLDYYDGFSAQAIILGRSIAKTDENCPTKEVSSPALSAWCQAE